MRTKSNEKGSWTRLAALGAELAAAIIGFSLLGIWIDRHFGTKPWGVLICSLLGITGGLYNLIRMALRTTQSPGGSPGDPER